jgi:predicted DNA-binding protein (UPF0251 family)/predicted Fe-Mo cluster-binding NifX family protein
MPRPCKCCRVGFVPGATYFKPAGVPLRELEEVQLSVEETEAIRLKDLEQMEQQAGAARMNISRPTFQRLLTSAHRKIAEGIINGKALRIEGGHYEFAALEPIKQRLLEGTMKIAVISDDGKTVSQHFGRAAYYEVFTAADGKITAREQRAKMGHQHFSGQEGGHEHQSGPHGFDAVSQNRHAGMAETIKDCQVIIAGGMGMGAFASLESYKIEPIITDEPDVETAVKRYLQGNLPNLRELLH